MTKNVNKGGRSKIVFTKKQVKKVEELAGYLNCEQIAGYFGFSEWTFHEIKKRQTEVFTAYKKGRFKKLCDYAQKLENKAMGIDEKGDTTAIIFYLKTQGGWSTENKNNTTKISYGNKTPIDIINNTLTALEEGKLGFSDAQQLTSLALAKMNIENHSQINKGDSEQVTMEQAREFAKELDEILQKAEEVKKRKFS